MQMVLLLLPHWFVKTSKLFRESHQFIVSWKLYLGCTCDCSVIALVLVLVSQQSFENCLISTCSIDQSLCFSSPQSNIALQFRELMQTGQSGPQVKHFRQTLKLTLNSCPRGSPLTSKIVRRLRKSKIYRSANWHLRAGRG